MTPQDRTIAGDAESASDETLEALFAALQNRSNFKLEAGAGAGKTYSLIKALNHILENKSVYLPRSDQRIACLTYTRVARDEIKARTDENPAIFADTLHGFLWEMISPYKKSLAAALPTLNGWKKLLAENPDIDGLAIDYDLGIRGIHEDRITLDHNDIPELAIQLFKNEKFRSLITDQFPVIFIDEYQDTPKGLAETLLSGHGHDRTYPVVGFFGDHWQQIYDNTCGSIEHPSLTSIPKNANFRSDRSVVDFLNKLRPELPQAPHSSAGKGTVTVYHSNDWTGERQSKNWKGQISQEATQECLDWLRNHSPSSTWIQKSTNLKILMLTHATIANELGYLNLSKVFKDSESFAKKENPVIEYLIDTVIPAMEAYTNRRYGELFQILGRKGPALHAPKDKLLWSQFFDSIISTCENGKIGEVLDCLCTQKLFSVPTGITKRESELAKALRLLGPEDQLEPRKLEEHQALRDVPFAEIEALRSYLEDFTHYSTKHSVKGSEFDDVIVLVGRGWTKYDFAKMIAAHALSSKPALRQSPNFQHSRNLFYVSASRAKHNLALLFVQELDRNALAVLEDWVGRENVISIEFDDADKPIPTDLHGTA